jgi:hypothetical protein
MKSRLVLTSLVAFLVFALIRAVPFAFESTWFDADPDAYRALAEAWNRNGYFSTPDLVNPSPTAYRPPVYPWLLSWILRSGDSWRWLLAFTHVVLGAMTALMAWDVARRLSSNAKLLYLVEDNFNKRVTGQSGRPSPPPTLPEDRARGGVNKRGEKSIRPIYWTAWLVGLGVAFDPILLRQSMLVMTETTAAFGLMLTWWLWIVGFPRIVLEVSPKACWFSTLLLGLLIGSLVGINSLVRASHQIWLPAMMLIWGLMIIVRTLTPDPSPVRTGERSRFSNKLVNVWLSRKCRSMGGSFRPTAFTAIGICLGWLLVVGPWAIRNYQAFGEPIWSTTHGGYTLYLANNPILFEHFQQGDLDRRWNEDAFHRRWEEESRKIPNSETMIDDVAGRLAWKTISENSSAFLVGCLARLGWFWALWPAETQASWLVRWLVALWYGAIFSLAIFAGMREILRRPCSRAISLSVLWLPALGLIAGLTVIHSVYWSNMRMRGPIMPFIYLAAIALDSLYRKESTTEKLD